MAQALLENKLADANRKNVEVLSAGTMMMEGLAPTEATLQLLKKEGIDVSNHRSHRINKNMIKCSDLILVMEKAHEERILQLAPQVKNRLFLLKEFAKIDDTDLNIADPIARPMEFYARTYRLIKEAIERIVGII
jgi:protein-tyrosine phosphatase